MHIRKTDDIHWRKSRAAARLLIRASRGPLSPKRAALAHQLGNDSDVLNRLIKQALILFHGRRPHTISLD
jgi:hypothetical protein